MSHVPTNDEIDSGGVMPSNAELDGLVIEIDAHQGKRMLAEVHKFLGRFVSYPSDHAHTAHALWCAHTHLMDKWESTPRLALLSAEPASGKTRALEITELLVPNPVTAVNVSPSYLFRKVGCGDGATILYDEIDTVFGPKAKENEEIRGLLNAGHRRGAVAGRCVVRGKNIETEEIPAYSAVALAGLGWLPDTILSRLDSQTTYVVEMPPPVADMATWWKLYGTADQSAPDTEWESKLKLIAADAQAKKELDS
jgi:hypothetical protein